MRADPGRYAWVLCLAALISLGAPPAAGEGASNAPREAAAVPGDGVSSAPGETAASGEGVSSALGGLAAAAPALAKLLDLGRSIEINAFGEDEFLDPDVAFVLSAASAGPDAIEARWDIAEGYYLYRDKFRFRAADGSGAVLSEAGFPTGKIKDDEYFGPMEVYYDSVAALVPVAPAAPASAQPWYVMSTSIAAPAAARSRAGVYRASRTRGTRVRLPAYRVSRPRGPMARLVVR